MEHIRNFLRGKGFVLALLAFPGIDEGGAPATEEQLWEQQAAGAAQSVADVPESSSSGGPSGAPSGSGSVSEPSELQTGSPAASASAGSGYTRPVSGQVLAVWSGDDLVYNETLGDWRTHNGVDYACKAGEDVLAPVSGTVSAVEDAAVRQGDTVTAGQKLGQAGTITGESALDPHIHLEVLDGDKYLDPVKLIGS